MAVNNSRSMNSEFSQGTTDRTSIELAPNRGGVIEHLPVERLSWPTYRQCGQHKESPFIEAHISRAGLPVEHKMASAYGDLRF